MSNWKKCRESNCVEVSIGPFDVVVRNSTDRNGPFVGFDYAEWSAFLVAVGNGEHRLPGDTGVTRAELHAEIARLAVEVEKLRAALRHPSSRMVTRADLEAARAALRPVGMLGASSKDLDAAVDRLADGGNR